MWCRYCCADFKTLFCMLGCSKSLRKWKIRWTYVRHVGSLIKIAKKTTAKKSIGVRLFRCCDYCDCRCLIRCVYARMPLIRFVCLGTLVSPLIFEILDIFVSFHCCMLMLFQHRKSVNQQTKSSVFHVSPYKKHQFSKTLSFLFLYHFTIALMVFRYYVSAIQRTCNTFEFRVRSRNIDEFFSFRFLVARFHQYIFHKSIHFMLKLFITLLWMLPLSFLFLYFFCFNSHLF